MEKKQVLNLKKTLKSNEKSIFACSSSIQTYIDSKNLWQVRSDLIRTSPFSIDTDTSIDHKKTLH